MRSFLLSFFLAAASVFSLHAQADERQFFSDVRGQWFGPGEIVAGKYKGTKFVCSFDGTSADVASQMKIGGSCRVGVFPQDMNAEISFKRGKYAGKFLDGASGDGMDILGGRYTRNRLVVDIKRNDLKGIMVANLQDPNRLKITISVTHKGKLVPVIGMNLARKSGAIVTGSIKQ